jgi:hypothetical protein
VIRGRLRSSLRSARRRSCNQRPDSHTGNDCRCHDDTCTNGNVCHQPRVGASMSCQAAVRRPARCSWRLKIIAVLTKIGLVGQGCTRHRKQTPCVPSLCVLRVSVHQTGSRGVAEARRARAGLARSVRRGCTRRWKRALHVPPRGGAVGGTACRAPTPVAGSGRLAQRSRPGRGSMYLRTAINPLYCASRGADGD